MDGKKFSGAFLAAALMVVGMSATAAHAMTAKECYKSFRAERKAGDLKGMEYKDFKAARCGDAAPAATSTTPAQAATPNTAAKAPTVQTPAPTTSTPPIGPTTAIAGSAVFPSAVASQYANLKPGRARMQTCLDQYKANKASNGNGGLRWIQKGGGYYSECNKRLKQ